MLKNEEIINKTVEKLVEIQEHFNFDGWLVNIENNLEDTGAVPYIENLKKFLILLKEKSSSKSNGPNDSKFAKLNK